MVPPDTCLAGLASVSAFGKTEVVIGLPPRAAALVVFATSLNTICEPITKAMWQLQPQLPFALPHLSHSQIAEAEMWGTPSVFSLLCNNHPPETFDLTSTPLSSAPLASGGPPGRLNILRLLRISPISPSTLG